MGVLFSTKTTKKSLPDLAKKRDRNGHISGLFFWVQNGYVLNGVPRGIGGEQRVPQQGRLRHEVASKHRACQTSKIKKNTRSRKRFSVSAH
ncbi:hypothetical protein D5676_14165 [Enterococcus faecalis]|nr:hypothetical protein [Enterococcus faecalis]EGO9405689.1 hypothetical protein [Enterococcus faecalis]